MTSGGLRVVTALVGAPLVLVATVLGGWAFTILIVFAALACQLEFYQLGRATASPFLTTVALLAGLSAVVGFVQPVFFGLAVLLAIAAILFFPFLYSQDRAVSVLGVLLAGILYPALLLGTLVGLRSSGSPQALQLTVLSVVLVWSSDTFAYYVGRAIGRHQLTPISPKKTWEGSIGGIVGAAGIAAAMKVLWVGAGIDWLHLSILVLVCGGVGQLGDIFESKLKRAADVKDSGALLPGHGGMLDRLDAVIVVAPLVYLIFVFIPGYLA